MTRETQIEIVEQMTATLCEYMTGKISSGHIPESWDGFELRQWLADAAREKYALDARRYWPGGAKRQREYRNTCLVENL